MHDYTPFQLAVTTPKLAVRHFAMATFPRIYYLLLGCVFVSFFRFGFLPGNTSTTVRILGNENQLTVQMSLHRNHSADVKHAEDIVVAKVSPASSSIQQKFGIVISDIRPTGKAVDWRVLRLLRQVSSTAPGTACEVWVAPGSILPENLQAYLKMQNGSVSVRYMPAVYVNSAGHKIDLHGKHGGHIGKALALRDSSFEFPILLDGDSWPCSGWLGAVKNATLEADVIWSLAIIAFGAVKGRNGKTYTSPLIRSQIDAFSHFQERNTGTIFGVRKNPASRRWLTDALDMRANQSAPQHRKHYKGFQDQAAFRESFFLHREELREYLLPLDKACRDPTNSKYQCNNCACACSKCNLIHGSSTSIDVQEGRPSCCEQGSKRSAGKRRSGG